MTETRIDPKYRLNLKGKTYVLYAGMLEAAMEGGLRDLSVQVIQLPSAENGHYAAVSATAVFEDGRRFMEVGDCSPASCSANMAPAALRLAATRAKARCLRDALVISECSFEELADDGDPAPNGHAPAPRAERATAPAGDDLAPTDNFCAECGIELKPAQIKLSQAKYSRSLCPTHQR